MPYYTDTSKLPACSHAPGCFTDEYGANHGVDCARSRAFQEQLQGIIYQPGAPGCECDGVGTCRRRE